MPPPPSRLENLAWSPNLSPDWLRAYIRREMTRRLGPETSDGRVQATCSECGSLYGVSERSRRRHAAGDLVPRCESCRSPALEPDAQDRKWANERLDDLARAVAALRLARVLGQLLAKLSC
jgi:hypothetical protein